MQAQIDLEQHQWRERILLFFIPANEVATWEAQQQILAVDNQGLQERDLIFYKIENDSALQQNYAISNDRFTAILIGKDGGEKLRQHEPLTLKKLYSTIDVMPMRRSEIRKRRQ
ncbi:MAG: DUF4174 domain-containing protein [Saprospiraceae bacterium]